MKDARCLSPFLRVTSTRWSLSTSFADFTSPLLIEVTIWDVSTFLAAPADEITWLPMITRRTARLIQNSGPRRYFLKFMGPGYRGRSPVPPAGEECWAQNDTPRA